MRFSFLLLTLTLICAGCGSSSSSGASHTPGVGTPTTGRSIITPAPASPVAPPAPIPTHTPFPATDYTATVTGTVTERQNGSPLAGAEVAVANGAKVARTNAFGEYRVSFPAGAPAPVTVTIPGFVQGLAMGALKPHAVAHVNFKLVKVVPGKPSFPPSPQGFGSP